MKCISSPFLLKNQIFFASISACSMEQEHSTLSIAINDICWHEHLNYAEIQSILEDLYTCILNS